MAAKLMGRWRSGAPLVLAPEKDDPALGADLQRNNNFNYKEMDPHGYAVPLGSHIRRMNPRDTARNMNRRRMIRRGGTYGPPLPEGAPDDGVERGIAAFVDLREPGPPVRVRAERLGQRPKFHELGNERDPIIGTQDGTFDYHDPEATDQEGSRPAGLHHRPGRRLLLPAGPQGACGTSRRCPSGLRPAWMRRAPRRSWLPPPSAATLGAQNRGVYPLGMSAINSGITSEPGFTYSNLFLYYSRDESKGPDGELLATGSNSVLMDMNSFVWVSGRRGPGRQVFGLRNDPHREQLARVGRDGIDQRRRRARRLVLPARDPGVADRAGRIRARSTASWRRPADSRRGRRQRRLGLLDPRPRVGPDVLPDEGQADRGLRVPDVRVPHDPGRHGRSAGQTHQPGLLRDADVPAQRTT